ncbi:uncharacterized protein TRIADDRAFT_61887 [Trichoplax adhaerens]|uniref:Guanylate cyclase domain-containing protein n=1 Tax=Trichoplax adhaerens TaxID=10228 RepID=B3SC90_TRIAD|nr:hypothetical protein TRIADDRAFT_61887 [Trichoplax adhaerens]EDV19619.1 hypothetical protein TRIADDRAFT_61887 [Trichoplax adhaerens]|eukprot:XP_002117857.1 hypothetical protein TRIADDRAFT_61887 [Trichoplax adhaerens]
MEATSKDIHSDAKKNAQDFQIIKHVPDILVQFHQVSRSPPYRQTIRCVSMIVDIKGFTALCERYTNEVGYRGADHLTKTLNKYLRVIIEGILRCQGDILKFAGDAILACWYGCDNSRKAEQIIRKVILCSLMIEEICTNWDTGIGVYLSVKTVISYGDVAVLYVGNDQYGVRHFITHGPIIDDMRRGQEIASRMSIGITLVSQLAWKFLVSFSIEAKDVELGFKAIYKQESIHCQSFQYQIEFPVRDSLEILPIQKDVEKFISPVVISKITSGEGIEYLSEIVRASIVFINLVLSFDHSSSLDSGEYATKTLQTAFRTVQENIHELKGHINKIFMFDKGCTFLVIFGMPGFKCEDVANRAVIAAARIKEGIDQLDISDEISIGIATGKVFCGVVGHESFRHEYTVIGRKVNMAARLMTNYRGKIICDKDTYANSKLKRSNFLNLHQIDLKGIGLVSPYEYSRDIKKDIMKAWVQDIRQFKYPMIGRSKELKDIEDRLQLMKNENDMQKIIIEGTDGIGKSRLLYAVSNIAQSMGYSVISAAGASDHTDSPLYLARMLLLKILHLDISNEKKSFDLNQLEASLSRYHWYRENIWFWKELFNLHPKEDYEKHEIDTALPEQNKKTSHGEILSRTLQSLIEFSHNTLIFIIDDIQVIDQESIQILNYLLRTTLVKLVITRSLIANEMQQNKLETKNDNSSKRETFYIRLEGLTKEELVNFACQALEVTKITSSLQRLITKYHRGGVPLWCEDLLHCLLYDGYIHIVRAKEYDRIDVRRHSSSSTAGSRRNSTLLLPSFWFRRASTRSETDQGSSMDASQDTTSKKSSIDQASTNQRRIAFATANPDYLLPSTLEANNICAIPNGISLSAIRIPDPIASAIQVKVDNLSQLDQLIIKHAAAIGVIFTLDTLHEILLVNQSITLDILQQCINRLKKNQLIECGSLSYGQVQDPSKQFILQNSCQCLEREKKGCYQLRFCTDGIQSTIYELLTTELRKDLHTRIATYLESRACQCQSCGGSLFQTSHRPVFYLSNRYSIASQHSLTMYIPKDNDKSQPTKFNTPNQDQILYGRKKSKAFPDALFKRRHTLQTESEFSSRKKNHSKRRFTLQELSKLQGDEDSNRLRTGVSKHQETSSTSNLNHLQMNKSNAIRLEEINEIHFDKHHQQDDDPKPYHDIQTMDENPSTLEDSNMNKGSIRLARKSNRRRSSNRYRRISLSFLRQKHERSLSYNTRTGAKSQPSSATKLALNQVSSIHERLDNPSLEGMKGSNPIEVAIIQVSQSVLKFSDSITSDEMEGYNWNRRNRVKSKLKNSMIRNSWRKSIKLMYRKDQYKSPKLPQQASFQLDDYESYLDQNKQPESLSVNRTSCYDDVNSANPTSKCKCDIILKSIYEELIHHWRLAGNTTKVFRYLIERGAGMINTSPIRALNYLQESKKLLIQNLSLKQYYQNVDDITISLQLSMQRGDNNDLFKDDRLDVSKDELFHLELLIGQAYLASDNINRAKEHFSQLLKELSCPQPQNLTKCKWQILVQQIVQKHHRQLPEQHSANSRTAEEELKIAQAKCLAHLYYVHRLNNDNTRAYVTALLQVNKIEQVDQEIDQRIIAYAELIEISFDRKIYELSDRLQVKAMQSIKEYENEINAKLLEAMVHLQSVLLVTKLGRGLLQQAVEHGHQALRKANLLVSMADDQENIKEESNSKIFLFCENSESLCHEQILNLKLLAGEKSDIFGLTWYHCCLLDLNLEINQHIDAYYTFANYVGQVFCEKIRDDDTILFYYITANHALWNARHKLWKMANQYIELATNLEPKYFSILMAARAYSKIVEANLLCWAQQKGNNKYKLRSKKSMKTLHAISRKYPVIKSRWNHLRAYGALIEGKERKAKKYLAKGLISASIPQDHRWIKCSQQHWFGINVDNCGGQLFHLPKPNGDDSI